MRTRTLTVGRLARLVSHQIRFDLLGFVRNREAVFYTIAMPVGFLVLFVAIFGNGMTHFGAERVRLSTYYVANLTVFGIVVSGFMSLAIILVEARENGILRRRRATPQPAWVLLVARAVTSLITAASIAVLLLVFGRVAYSASVPFGSLPALATAVAVGCLTGCMLGFAAATAIRSIQGAQPAVMAMAMPLFFISGVFVPWSLIPPWLQRVGEVFPVRPLAESVLATFVHRAAGGPWSPADLAIVVAWGLLGLVLALRRFRWAPQDV